MIFKLEAMYKDLAESLVERYGEEKAWAQWFDVEKLEQGKWSEALIPTHIYGRNCARLTNMGIDSEEFTLASRAMAYKLSGDERLFTAVQEHLIH